jgi:hypothetical protein
MSDLKETQAGPAENESLDSLQREADLLDTSDVREAQAGAVVAVQEATASAEAELLGALQLVRGMVFPLLAASIDERRMSALASVWNDTVLAQSSAAGAQVMALHGWTLGGAFSRYGPYIALGAALAPPVLATRAIMAPTPEEKRQVKPAAQAGEGAADGAGQQQ